VAVETEVIDKIHSACEQQKKIQPMPTVTPLIANHLRQVYQGGNWTTANIKQLLSDVSWSEAQLKVHELNSIAMLVYHLHYYVRKVTPVLEGQPLVATDKESFDVPLLPNQEAWEALLTEYFADAETFAQRIENLPDEILKTDFTDPKYGNYFRNLIGIIEHIHYHMGQISILKKIIRSA
jgi:uncharacterized damage-inducible protein DinB